MRVGMQTAEVAREGLLGVAGGVVGMAKNWVQGNDGWGKHQECDARASGAQRRAEETGG